jgi:hypothetical protein
MWVNGHWSDADDDDAFRPVCRSAAAAAMLLLVPAVACCGRRHALVTSALHSLDFTVTVSTLLLGLLQ